MVARDILKRSFSVVLEDKARFLQALGIPFFILLSIDLAALLSLPNYIGWILVVFEFGIYGNFAVTTHRLVILGPNSVPKYGLSKVTKREVLFISYLFGVTAGPIVPLIPFLYIFDGQAKVLAGFAVIVVYLYLISRLSLVLPATAIDKWVTPGASFKMTEAHQRAMFVVVVLFPALLAIPGVLVGLWLSGIVSVLFSSFVGTLVMIFTVAALSLAYEYVIANKAT